MSEPIKAFPLQWPNGWKRTPQNARERARFGRSTRRGFNGNTEWARPLTVAEATLRVRQSLERMGVRDDDVVISSNVTLRLDGQPRSGQPEPSDPGVAVYWRRKGEQQCMAIDQYDKVAGNLGAIAATLEALRAIERHGGAAILDRAFTGFVALTGPSTPDWWDVLEVRRDASRDIVLANYRRLRSDHHPDRGGDPAAFQRIQRAFEQFEANRK
jgi:hypothetical protein